MHLGANHYRYCYKTSGNVRKEGEVFADSKEEAFAKLRTVGIRAIRVLADGEEPPKPKKFFEASEGA